MLARNKETDTDFQEAEVGAYWLAFYFSLSSKMPNIFVTVNVTFDTFSYVRLLSKVETDISQCCLQVPLT